MSWKGATEMLRKEAVRVQGKWQSFSEGACVSLRESGSRGAGTGSC